MTQVSGKVAFITGGGSGVGLGQAKVFAEAGCKIALGDQQNPGFPAAHGVPGGKG
jgi:NAD(P)-dependent dehydrogenase (short-subunit alcohol dehydrogenase family)